MQYLKVILARGGEVGNVAEFALGGVCECEAFGLHAVEVGSKLGDAEVSELADYEIVFTLECYLWEIVLRELMREVAREENALALDLDIKRRREIRLAHVLGLDI